VILLRTQTCKTAIWSHNAYMSMSPLIELEVSATDCHAKRQL